MQYVYIVEDALVANLNKMVMMSRNMVMKKQMAKLRKKLCAIKNKSFYHFILSQFDRSMI